jgi:sterol desaturase/sphingolipid hydroxylase (fatty acid hydroxylase superfamily)
MGLLRGLPPLVATLMTALILDLALWTQHKVSHEWPWLWRLHRVHHGDQAMDLTTAFRFHPLELGVSLIWKLMVVLVLGGPVAGVLLFESMLLVGNLFEHANGHLPEAIDRFLRSALVIPRLHAIHHATNSRDQRSNFGFFFIWWDRMFRTIRWLPSGSAPRDFGLGDGRERSILDLLRQPFEPIRRPISGA